MGPSMTTSTTRSSTPSSATAALRLCLAARPPPRPRRVPSPLSTTTPGSWRAPMTASPSRSTRRASLKLSKYLPQYIAKNMKGYVDGFLEKHDMSFSDVDFWAVHPGGRRIIEEAQNGLGLTEEQTKYSWSVLNDYGNMLSPSVMFVLELILNEHKEELNKGNDGFSQGLAFSFSPGVGAEGILLKVL